MAEGENLTAEQKAATKTAREGKHKRTRQLINQMLTVIVFNCPGVLEVRLAQPLGRTVALRLETDSGVVMVGFCSFATTLGPRTTQTSTTSTATRSLTADSATSVRQTPTTLLANQADPPLLPFQQPSRSTTSRQAVPTLTHCPFHLAAC